MSLKGLRKFIFVFIAVPMIFCFGAKSFAQNKVSIDFDNVDINVFIKFISEVTNKNFIIDNRVKGNVTVVSPGKISPEEAYRVFESVLDVNGFAAVPAGDVVKIVSTFEARTKNMETIKGRDTSFEGDTMVTQVIPLDYADPRSIQRLIAPLVSKRSAVMSYEESSMILITDYQSNVSRLIKIIEAVDIRDTGREISIIPLEYADASELSKTLKLIFPATQKSDEKITINKVNFIPDERTNSIIAVAGKVDLERIKQLVAHLDLEKPKGDEKFYVYYLEHSDSESLAEVLQSIASGTSRTGSSSESSKKSAPVVSGDVAITADKDTNTLIIKASRNDYEVIERLIEKLDINRPMVYLECLIVEMNMSNDFGLGSEWALGYEKDIKSSKGVYGGGFSGSTALPYSTLGGLAKTGNLPSGFSMGVITEAIEIGGVSFPNLGAVISAYKNDKNMNILSTPQIMTLDNQTAKISVGKNIPYLIKATTGTDNAYSNYEYKDVGVLLEITPQINQDGLVKLKIFQEVSRIDSVAGEFGELPTTLKRNIETTVVVEKSNTVVLGGLIDESFAESENKVPCLGDIPILGYLFKTRGSSKDKTNMYVFITPHIVSSSETAGKLYREKRKHIDETMEKNLKKKTKDIPLYD
ncbi:MAG: type II secretion system secretin GspD [Desulforegulaceae bacterium]|nr:type II secretion system secretin GspD [Desulforegulaceae bacterium]